MSRLAACLALLFLAPVWANAAPREGFHAGPVFEAFGDIATVESDLPIPPGTAFKVVFDITDAATPGEINRAIDSAARFINMHAEAGVPLRDIRVAIVVHGGAADDLLRPSAYAKRKGGKTNGAEAELVALIAHGVDVYLCGQTAVARGIAKPDLTPGVKLSLSAMTAFALLQQQGYTLNPS